MRDGIWTDAILFFDWFERQSTVDRRPKLKRAASHQTNLFLPVKFYFCRNLKDMKQVWMILVVFVLLIFFSKESQSQCSICTKTAQQLGEKTGRGLNAGILYLAAAPLLIVGFIGYRWWKSDRES